MQTLCCVSRCAYAVGDNEVANAVATLEAQVAAVEGKVAQVGGRHALRWAKAVRVSIVCKGEKGRGKSARGSTPAPVSAPHLDKVLLNAATCGDDAVHLERSAGRTEDPRHVGAQ